MQQSNKKRINRLYKLETIMYAAVTAILIGAILWIVFSDPVICVSGISMNPTYNDGDYLTGTKVDDVNGLDYGDIVVLKRPDFTTELIIKRVIGLPGDKILVTDHGVYVNDQLIRNDFPMTGSNSSSEIITVGENEIYVMGDNRDHSIDSRYFGAAEFSLVKYKVTGDSNIADNWLFSFLKQLAMVKSNS